MLVPLIIIVTRKTKAIKRIKHYVIFIIFVAVFHPINYIKNKNKLIIITKKICYVIWRLLLLLSKIFCSARWQCFRSNKIYLIFKNKYKIFNILWPNENFNPKLMNLRNTRICGRHTYKTSKKYV